MKDVLYVFLNVYVQPCSLLWNWSRERTKLEQNVCSSYEGMRWGNAMPCLTRARSLERSSQGNAGGYNNNSTDTGCNIWNICGERFFAPTACRTRNIKWIRYITTQSRHHERLMKWSIVWHVCWHISFQTRLQLYRQRFWREGRLVSRVSRACCPKKNVSFHYQKNRRMCQMIKWQHN